MVSPAGGMILLNLSLDEKEGGIVLCKVGTHRVAFLARQVSSIELWAQGGREAAHARQAFLLEPQDGRALLAEGGEAVVVDALEVSPEAPALLAPPPMLVGGAGGALRGFLSMGDQLWPLLRLAEFFRYLNSAHPSGAVS